MLHRIPQARIAELEGISPAEIAATTTRPLTKDDLQIDWTAPRRRVIDTVRAYAPRPLARTEFAGVGALKIAAARADDAHAAPAGLPFGPVVRDGKHPFLGALCGDGGVVALERVVAPGRPPTDGETFARSWYDRAARASAP
jgi:methionyl-tRNA formyltransferase